MKSLADIARGIESIREVSPGVAKIEATAQAVREAGVPDELNRWIGMTPEKLAAAEAAQRRIETAAPKIGPKEQQLRERRESPLPVLTPEKRLSQHTTMRKKPHPADIAAEAAIPAADHFEVSLFVNRKHLVESASSLAEARAIGVALETIHRNGRLSLVYAVTKEGRAFLVPRDYSLAKEPAQQSAIDGQKETAMPSKTTKSKARNKIASKPAPKPASAAGKRSQYDWATAEEKAAKGVIAPAPDFSAKTHERFRPVLDEVVKLAKAGDIDALRKISVNPISSSPKAVDRYRKICLTALKAKAAA